MNNNYVVNVEYRNKNDEEPVIKTYDFEQYANKIKFELMRLIMDVENAFILANNGKNKDEWPKEMLDAFQNVRRKLLNQANAIERLPINLSIKR